MSTEPLQAAMRLAEATAADRRERALDFAAGSLEELRQLRFEVRQAIRAADDAAPLRHVRPWLWNVQTSGGGPLTPAGEAAGYELRLSWYHSPIR